MSGRVEPTYRPSGEPGEIVVYAGDLDVKVGDEARTVKGQLELRLGAGPLVARFAGPASEELHFVAAHETTASVSVPAGAPLVPPPATILPERLGDTYWIEARIPIRSELAAGEVAHAQRFIFHISGALEARLPSVEVFGAASRHSSTSAFQGGISLSQPSPTDAANRTSGWLSRRRAHHLRARRTLTN